LGGEVSVAGWDAEKEGVVFFEFGRGDEGDGGGLAGSVHFGEDFLGEGFLDPVGGNGMLAFVQSILLRWMARSCYSRGVAHW